MTVSRLGLAAVWLSVASCLEYPLTHLNMTCQWNTVNASFDLSALQLTTESQLPFYAVAGDGDAIQYYINICDNVLAEPPYEKCYNETLRAQLSGQPLGYCSNITTVYPDDPSDFITYDCAHNLTRINTSVAAYQILTGADSCYRVHDGYTPPTWSYIDAEDPATGVELIYSNGDFCDYKVGHNRELRVRFYCADEYEEDGFAIDEDVYTLDGCVYALDIHTVFGCPQECPTVEFSLCAGNGECQFDFHEMLPKCFCYSGFYGDDCTSTEPVIIELHSSSEYNKYVTIVVVVTILFAFVFMALVFVVCKLLAVDHQKDQLLQTQTLDSNAAPSYQQ